MRRRTVLTVPVLAAVVVGVAVAGPLVPAAPAAAATATTMRTASSTALFGNGPVVLPTSEAAKNAAALANTDPAGSAAAATIARYPVATWLGDWTTGSTLTKTLRAATDAAAAAGSTAVFVTYAIPDRDCGGYSAGGFDETTYDAWVDQVVAALAGTRSAVIVEPDSLAMLSGSRCTAVLDQQRYRILSREVAAFTAAGIPAYLDGGNSNWIAPATMAARLDAAGVRTARGFFTNVANYYPTVQEQAYAEQVSAATGGSHYVIDTSRNGQGWRGTWCNGPGAGLGTTPRVVSDGTALDALLWVKTPGASDGTCDGGPAAGKWYSAYAQALVANAVLGEPGHDPAVTLDGATVAPAGIAVRGTASDADTPGSAVTVAVTVDGSVVRTVSTAVRTGEWSAVAPAGAGTHTVCAVARNSGPGTDTTSGCRSVRVAAAAPTGTFDSAASASHRRVTVRGWTFDRDDTAKPVTVTVTVDGSRTARVAASATRTDVDRSFGSGAAHGVLATVVSPSGRHRLCLVATGIGAGGDTTLGCRTVSVR